MTALVFVDTSVLLYSVDAGPTETGLRRRLGEPNYGKQPRANQTSVLQEFYCRTTQKFFGSREPTRAEVRDLLASKGCLDCRRSKSGGLRIASKICRPGRTQRMVMAIRLRRLC
jgi:predicted nucleic acid-binding protein